jgi:hypothetical protein
MAAQRRFGQNTCNITRNMKMLFLAAEPPRIEQTRSALQSAGIACEVRPPASAALRAAELWIQNAEDCHRAFRLCVQRGVAFSRRAIDKVLETSSEDLGQIGTAG